MSELKRLLVGPEQDQLAALQERIDNPSSRIQDVSSVLAEAITVRTSKDEKLSKALAPTIEESIRVSVQRNPRPLVDAIFPVMGPAIRKGITETLQRMIRSLGQMLEQGFSLKGLKWRLEAYRTGKSYGEIVLLHTLAYRVEQVFLIHRKTGILLQHVAAESVALQDSDMVSGMLTAIQDFVRDSFGMDAQESVGNLEIGDLSVWVEPSPHAILAAVIRGTAPGELRTTLQEAIEGISLEMAEPLAAFEGETAPFEATRRRLESCLVQAQREEEGRRISRLAWGAIGLVAALILLWIGFGIRNLRRWDRYLGRLRSEPGIVVIEAERSGSGGVIRGLRDPLAADPAAIAQEMRLKPGKIRAQWEPYYAVHPAFVLKRAQELLSPPSGVTLDAKDGVLHIRGSAPHLWLVEARGNALFVPGVSSVQWDDLQETDVERPALERARALLAPPETVTLSLENGVLRAGGSAPYEWLLEARRMVRLVPGISEFREDKLTLTDVPRPTLDRALQVLAPPPTVSLDLRNGVLYAAGTAPESWAEEARRLAALIPGVSDFRTDQLAVVRPVTPPPAPAVPPADLPTIRNILSPPDTVALALSEGVLTASGKCTSAWRAMARRLTPLIPGVEEYQEELEVTDAPDLVLAAARAALAPPETVTLELREGVLFAFGVAPYEWMQEARRRSASLPDVRGYVDSALTEWHLARERIEGTTVYFTSSDSGILPDEQAKLDGLLSEFNSLLGAVGNARDKVRVRLTGHTEEPLFGVGKERHIALGQARAQAVRNFLVSKGLPAELFMTQSAGFSEPLRAGGSSLKAIPSRRVTFEVLFEDNPGKQVDVR